MCRLPFIFVTHHFRHYFYFLSPDSQTALFFTFVLSMPTILLGRQPVNYFTIVTRGLPSCPYPGIVITRFAIRAF